jgi:hypothetical protein
MTLDEELLAAARKAGTASAAAQDQADIAKAVYHHSVLRLHRAGGSMREIAEALKISHQRVHQIVEQSKRTEQCWFCGRTAGDVGKMMARAPRAAHGLRSADLPVLPGLQRCRDQRGSFTTVTKKSSIWRITSMNLSKSTGLVT